MSALLGGSIAEKSRKAAGLALLVALLTGAGLRACQLDRQILADDEFHAFRAALRADLDAGYLWTHNTIPEDPESDYSIALALWNRLLVASVGVSEWSMRLPVWLAGVATLGFVALMAARLFGTAEAVLAAWLAALSPLLVLFSRYDRPYGAAAACCAGAFLAWLAWERRASARAGAAAAGCAAAALFLSPTALPTLACIAVGGAFGSARRRWLGWVGVGCIAALALHAPGLGALRDFGTAKLGAGSPPLAAWWGALASLVGASAPPAIALALLLLCTGAVAGLRRQPRATGVLLGAALSQALALLVLRPYGSDQPLVVARYALVAWPGLLVLAALGLWTLADGLVAGRLGGLSARARTGVAWGSCAAVLGAAAAAGPLPDIVGRENAFGSHPHHYAARVWQIAPDSAPAYYRELAGEASPQGALVEAPWVLEWPLNLYGDYQALHGRAVRGLSGYWVFRDPAVSLRSMVGWQGDVPQLDPEEQLVIHRDVVREWQTLAGGPLVMRPELLAEAARRYRVDAAALASWAAARADLERVYRDEWIEVYARR